MRHEQDPLGVGGDEALEAVAVPQRLRVRSNAGARARGGGQRQQTPAALDPDVGAAHRGAAPAAALVGGVVGRRGSRLRRALADARPAVRQGRRGGACDRVQARERPRRERSASATRPRPASAGGDPAPRRAAALIAAMAAPAAATRVQRLGQRGQPLAEPAPRRGGGSSTWNNRWVTAQRAKAAASGRRSGGFGVRPRAVLTKSSQTASPSRMNSIGPYRLARPRPRLRSRPPRLARRARCRPRPARC